MERSFPYFRGGKYPVWREGLASKVFRPQRRGWIQESSRGREERAFPAEGFFRKKEGRGTNSSFPQEAWRKPAAGKNMESSSLPSLASLLKARQTLPSSSPPPPPPRLLLKLRLRGRDEVRGSEDARGGIEVERR